VPLPAPVPPDALTVAELRFDPRKDNPYRDYDAIVTKIMNDADFRRTPLAPGTAGVWRRTWK
jgi:hypothetical protein